MTIMRMDAFKAFLESERGKALSALLCGMEYTDWYLSPNPRKRQLITEMKRTVYDGLWAKFLDPSLNENLEDFRILFLSLVRQEITATEETLAELAELLKIQLGKRDELHMSLEHRPSLDEVNQVWGDLTPLVPVILTY